MKIITVNGMTFQQRVSKLLRDVEKENYKRIDKVEYIKACIDSILEKSVFVDSIKMFIVLAALTTTEIPLQTLTHEPAPTCVGVHCVQEAR